MLVVDINERKYRKTAMQFIILLGVISLFADMTYEGARSINGPYLQQLGASGTVVGIVAGLGELTGYALRIISGRISDRSRQYWTVLLLGYALNLLSVPLLALAGHWQLAVALIIAERAGKAIRVPTRDAMLSFASRKTGRGWGFGLHGALDQLGATLGPLLVSAVLFYKKEHYQAAYALLLAPAVCALSLLLVGKRVYPRPEALEVTAVKLEEADYSPLFRLYVIAGIFVAAGYTDYPLIAYHFKQTHLMDDTWIPVMYAIAMVSEAISSLVAGKLYDKTGIPVIIAGTGLSLFFAPLVFMHDFRLAVAGMVLWGIGMGVQGSALRAAVAELVPPRKRGSAYGLFDFLYGIGWFAGSVFMGYLYDTSLVRLVSFSMQMQFFSLVVLVIFIIKTKQAKRKNTG